MTVCTQAIRLLALTVLGGAVLFTQAVSAGEVEDAIAEQIAQALPALGELDIQPTEAEGLYQVITEQNEVVYTTADGQFLISGELLQVTEGGLVNVTEATKSELRVNALADMGDDGVIRFAADGEQKAAINVFTDIDCGYCRKLHADVPRLNELGITVNYYAFPRSGPGSSSFAKYESVWCAEDQRSAMNSAKQGESVTPASCDNPVMEQYRLGRQLGVTGTPAIVLEDGNMVRGYVPAEQLAKGLGVL
ncbi:thioredoxin fold domain-containing protein [Marinobacter sp. CA1]|uniref:thioredoxin fold domain-containing protein n=1 Tax=Marinobacter sp. CA1 TaxID=2817656 RepID=UPI001D07D633|nr:thioredoxin fold domain-containing protein [Marinobacter sp. CA1]UDL04179.1 thioredoxin fold domain-containing protein [Marinobacter sp. CA1]